MAEIDETMIARLVAQAESEGAALVTLRALVEEASEAGVGRALRRLGLEDARARSDLWELRELLGAWRDAKTTAWRAIVAWLVRLGLAAVLAGLAVKAGLPGRISA